MSVGTGDSVSVSASAGDVATQVPGAPAVPDTADIDIPPMPPVLYEDDDLLAVDKPAGLVVHPAYKHPSGTLADAVFARQAARQEGRPWLLLRLDRETSGVILFAKSERARRGLVRQFERRMVWKRYLALVAGTLEATEGLIDEPLRRDPADRRRTIVAADGQPAETWYRVLAAHDGAALVLAEPHTGRTHQIRAHLAARGAPLLGDIRYDEGQTHVNVGVGVDMDEGVFAPRVMLHAWQLSFIHPAFGSRFCISAPIPSDMAMLTSRLQLASGLAHLCELATGI